MDALKVRHGLHRDQIIRILNSGSKNYERLMDGENLLQMEVEIGMECSGNTV